MAHAQSLTALEVATADCDRGRATACREVGLMYEDGQNTGPDAGRAVQFYDRACTTGDLRGCTFLGLMYLNGRGVAVDQAKARLLYDRACQGGDALGCPRLGALYEDGLGVPRDLPRASALFDTACTGGESWSCNELGLMYENGNGVVADFARSVALYTKSCELRNARGCAFLGWMYANGRGTATDDARAAALYRQSCEASDMLGCERLAGLTQEVRGTAADRAQAAQLYRRACDGGRQTACNSLAAMAPQAPASPGTAASAAPAPTPPPATATAPSTKPRSAVSGMTLETGLLTTSIKSQAAAARGFSARDYGWSLAAGLRFYRFLQIGGTLGLASPASNGNITFGYYGISGGLVTTPIRLEQRPDRWRFGLSLVTGLEGFIGHEGSQSCGTSCVCVDCVVKDIEMRAGVYVEPGLQLYFTKSAGGLASYGVGVFYRAYLAATDLVRRVTVNFVCLLGD